MAIESRTGSDDGVWVITSRLRPEPLFSLLYGATTGYLSSTLSRQPKWILSFFFFHYYFRRVCAGERHLLCAALIGVVWKGIGAARVWKNTEKKTKKKTFKHRRTPGRSLLSTTRIFQFERHVYINKRVPGKTGKKKHRIKIYKNNTTCTRRAYTGVFVKNVRFSGGPWETEPSGPRAKGRTLYVFWGSLINKYRRPRTRAQSSFRQHIQIGCILLFVAFVSIRRRSGTDVDASLRAARVENANKIFRSDTRNGIHSKIPKRSFPDCSIRNTLRKCAVRVYVQIGPHCFPAFPFGRQTEDHRGPEFIL